MDLEAQKLGVLKEEESWRQKSRAIWITKRVFNTKFFHKFADNRRASNAIWELSKEDGKLTHKQKDLQS